jgi:hypothetical protein
MLADQRDKQMMFKQAASSKADRRKKKTLNAKREAKARLD